METLALTNEKTLEINYIFALDKPRQKSSQPQDEWISVIRSLGDNSNGVYAAGFFNGDVKLYDGVKHAEIVSLTNLLHGDGDSEISDMLWFTSEKLKSNVLVACSGSEANPALSILKQTSKNELEVIARSA